MDHPKACDCCGTLDWDELNQMCHVPGIVKNGVYQAPWWCDECAEGMLDCPDEFLNTDGSCQICN